MNYSAKRKFTRPLDRFSLSLMLLITIWIMLLSANPLSCQQNGQRQKALTPQQRKEMIRKMAIMLTKAYYKHLQQADASKDVRMYFQLIAWCQKYRLYSKLPELYQRILKLDPNNDVARKALARLQTADDLIKTYWQRLKEAESIQDIGKYLDLVVWCQQHKIKSGQSRLYKKIEELSHKNQRQVRQKIYKYSTPGTFSTSTPFFRPFPCISEEDILLVSQNKISTTNAGKLLRNYVDRIENYCRAVYKTPASLIAWLSKNPKVRDAFWLALNDEYDNIGKAIAIFEELRQKHPQQIKRFYHLAIAIAVVWDDPDAVISCRHRCIWGYELDQFKPLLSYHDVFNYFTHARFRRYFVFRPDTLQWPFLVHVVNLDISRDEIFWALKKFGNRRSRLHQLYELVRYDEKRQKSGRIALGSRDYILPNIFESGGICGDQAHFMTRTCKSFGIPSMKVSGQSKYGGHHAWAGYLERKRGKNLLNFTGRYSFDTFYTGEIFDPQTRTLNLDRFIAMMYEGVSYSYSDYMQARILTRIAASLQERHPQESLKLTCYALKINAFVKPAWDLLMAHMKSGTLSKKQGLKYVTVMKKALKEHPDLTMLCLQNFIDCIPPDQQQQRQQYYRQIFALYRERPDLQIQLRVAQCQELAAHNKKARALQLGMQTCIDNAEQGGVVLPLIKVCLKIAEGQTSVLKRSLRKIENKMPKKRGDKDSAAYEEFTKLIQGI